MGRRESLYSLGLFESSGAREHNRQADGSNTVSLLDGDGCGFLEVVRDNGVATGGPGTEDGAGWHIWKTSHEAKKRGAGLYKERDTRRRLDGGLHSWGARSRGVIEGIRIRCIVLCAAQGACWNVRDSMYAGTLYNGYWSEYLAGFSHCSVKSSRQLQLLLSTCCTCRLAAALLFVLLRERLTSLYSKSRQLGCAHRISIIS